MFEEHVRVALDATQQAFGESCLWMVDFDRDASDSFAITISRGGSAFDGPELRKGDVLPLLPAGSRWEAAVGWRSFFGMPFRWAGSLRLAIGVEGIAKHASRGAYPVSRFAVFDFAHAPVGELAELAALLAPGGASIEVDATYGVVPSASASPRDHVAIDAWILSRAAASYREHRRLLFRSLLLSEDQIPASKTVKGRIGSLLGGRRTSIDFDDFLLATVPSIRATFSFRARSWMKMYERKNQDNPEPDRQA